MYGIIYFKAGPDVGSQSKAVVTPNPDNEADNWETNKGPARARVNVDDLNPAPALTSV